VCTASWLTQGGRLHLFFNRDELTTREPALPPTRQARGGVSYLAPTDARSGGTWIAATELGSALALLNKSGGVVPAAPKSRGGVIPALVACRAPEELFDRLRDQPLERLAPFRLLGLWRRPAAGLALGWDGERLEPVPLDPALGLLASSGLGDDRALASRGALWRRRRDAAPRWGAESHRAFHREHAPLRGAWSVCVHRRDAASVSYTEVELAPVVVRLRYFAGSPCSGSRPVETKLAASTPAAT
jgi:hypothetical protein